MRKKKYEYGKYIFKKPRLKKINLGSVTEDLVRSGCSSLAAPRRAGCVSALKRRLKGLYGSGGAIRTITRPRPHFALFLNEN